MSKFIGRLVNIGLGRETVRGTAVGADFFFPKIELTVDDKIIQVVNESSVGVIEDAEGATLVMKMSELSLKGRVNNESFGLILKSVLGDEPTPVVVGGETIVFDHTFKVLQSAQHPALTINIDDPNGDVQFPLGMAESLELNVELGLYVEYTFGMLANKSASGTVTPSYPAVENIFVPQHAEFKFATDLAGLGAAPAIQIKKLNMTISKNSEEDQVLGNVDPIDRLNRQFQVEGTVELLYEDRSFIDSQLLTDTQKALRLSLKNTGVTIGSASNPEIEIDMAKVKLSEVARDLSNNEITRQTLTFKAFYSLSDAKSIEIRLRNLQTTVY